MIVETLAGAARRLRAWGPSAAPREQRDLGFSWAHLRAILNSGTAHAVYPTTSGQTLTEPTSLMHPTVYSAVHLKASVLAQLPLQLHRRLGEDAAGSEIDRGHPLNTALERLANPRHAAFNAMQFVAASVFLRGNAVAALERNADGRVTGYYPLRWDRLRVDVEGNDTVFVYEIPEERGGGEIVYRRGTYWHAHGMSLDGVVGLSPIAAIREAVGYGITLQEFSSRMLENGHAVGAIVTHPGRLGSDEEERDAAVRRLKSRLDEFKAAENAGKTLILEDDMKWESVGLSAADTDFLNSLRYNREDIAAIFGVPVHLLGGSGTAGNFTIETLSQEFVTYHLQPWLTMFEQTIARDMLDPADRDTHFARFDATRLLRTDPEKRGNFYVAMIQAGVFTRNEVRALEDLNALEGGDELLVPLNMGTVDPETGAVLSSSQTLGGADGSPPTLVGAASASRPRGESRAVDARPRLAESFGDLFADLFTQLIRAEGRELRKIARKSFGDPADRDAGAAPVAATVAALAAFAAAHEEIHADDGGSFRALAVRRARPVVGALGRGVIALASSEVRAPVDAEGLEEFLDALAEGLAARYGSASIRSARAQLLAGAADPHLALEEALAEWEETRPARAAARETIGLSRASAKETFRRAGATRLVWVTRGDSCPFCRRMNGRTISFDPGASFVREGETFEAEAGRPGLSPRNLIGHPPLHRGCDCDIRAVFD